MRVLIVSLLFSLLSCSEPPSKPVSDSTRIRNEVGSAVVRITGVTSTGRSSGGTGFSVITASGNKYILTNKHICGLADSNNQLTVEFPNLSRKYLRKIIEISSEHDLCLVESIPTFNPSLSIADSIDVGQDIFVVGHPKLFDLTVAGGTYIQEASIMVAMSKSGINTRVAQGFSMPNLQTFNTFRFNVYSRGGNSGSPIVNTDGQVVSVLFAGNRSDVMETYGVPLTEVKRFINGY